MKASLNCSLRTLLILAFIAGCAERPGIAQEIPANQSRTDVENELRQLEVAWSNSTQDNEARRDLVAVHFKLGNFHRANELLQPLAAADSTNLGNLRLGAKLSLLLGDYPKAIDLFRKLRALSEVGTDDHATAIRGLIMVAYQTNEYAQVKDIELPVIPDGDVLDTEKKLASLLEFMKTFEGQPYRIQWQGKDSFAHLPITNEFNKLGALPEVDLEINGHAVHFILDTGGDRLYLDSGIAEKIGIRIIAKRTAKYAYTGGKTVEEPLGVAESVKLGDVTLSNVPVIVAQWKSIGQKSDGVLTTQILKQFLSTIDYKNRRITLRPRGDASRRQVLESLGPKPPVTIPFALSRTHLMFAKGGINDHSDLNFFVDSGLAASMPMIIVNDAAQDLGLADQKTEVAGTKYFWVPLNQLRLGPLESGATQALGNVLVEVDSYRSQGFFFDALISHQFLKQFGSWTIDFDSMTYYFPAFTQ